MSAFERLRKASEVLGLKIELTNDDSILHPWMAGAYFPREDKIVLRELSGELSEIQMTRTLAHELGHALLQSRAFFLVGTEYQDNLLLLELEAEAFNHDVTDMLGVDPDAGYAQVVYATSTMHMLRFTHNEPGVCAKYLKYEPALIYLFSANFVSLRTTHLRENIQAGVKMAKSQLQAALDLENLPPWQKAIEIIKIRRFLSLRQKNIHRVWRENLRAFNEIPVTEKEAKFERDNFSITFEEDGLLRIDFSREWINWIHGMERIWSDELRKEFSIPDMYPSYGLNWQCPDLNFKELFENSPLLRHFDNQIGPEQVEESVSVEESESLGTPAT